MKPTLGQVFAASLAGLALVLGLLFYLVFDTSRRGLTEGSERVRDGASRQISSQVSVFLGTAPSVAEQFQRELQRDLTNARDPAALEKTLFTLILANPFLGEVTLTYAESQGFDPDGKLRLSEHPRGQISVIRLLAADGATQLRTRHVHREQGDFVADYRDIPAAGRLEDAPLLRESGTPDDPTIHLTFTTPAKQRFYGTLLPSDMHWSEFDMDRPANERRVEVSVQQVMTDSTDRFVGVLRVSLLTQQLDRAMQIRLVKEGAVDPHRIFICDSKGRLITRMHPQDRFQEFDDEALRVAPADLPGEVAQALADPQLRAVSDEKPVISGSFTFGGEEFLSTFRFLPDTQDWIVGVVVPRAHYLGRLIPLRNRLLGVFLGTVLLILIVGGLVLRGVKRAHSRIVRESLKMNAFDFSPAPTASAFRDIGEVLESMEKAKTAMRAMGKYVPIDLVRRLYRDKQEPFLGGQSMDISIMFTDIKDFTSLSEETSPDALADALGRYLDVMSGIIQRDSHGTIDKYIGDSIMTLWNAPEPFEDHARMACLAALKCRDAGLALAASPEWQGRPRFETRFGLHRGTALVGHFGAHDRMNYTAIGDAVNLASRLEGLNKQYGSTIIASESIVESAKEHFAFRFLDLVRVKGKQMPARIYELLGSRVDKETDITVLNYEQAFGLYTAQDFAGTMALLERQAADSPSAVLLQRCREYLKAPPPANWDGVYIATTK